MRLETKRRLDTFLYAFLFLMGSATILVTLGIIYVLLSDAIRFFTHPDGGGFPSSLIRFFTETEWSPTFVTKKIGIWPLLSGTFLIAGIALLVSLPLGILIAVYLSEYASVKVRETVKPFLDFLEAVPTVVYGYFALLLVTPLLQKLLSPLGLTLEGMNALSPGIVLGIMILPFTASMVEDALKGVPQYLREASYALGASKLKTAFSVVIPAARSGILAAYLLGVSRAIGETMVVAIAAGMYPQLTLNPLQPVQTITGYIVQVALGDLPFGSFEYLSIFAAGLTLFVITLVFNSLAVYVKSKVVGY
ncbi:phosphate ABC transporter membrane protein 1 (PhoT family) [Hydrogenivirga caldilitoris]|uniref:Phosphate transport system permease protein n=1 Tax=Hydrogenivirga caldilitoris TaxID=246264 RepID=A0A497XPR4_9AQUI|nr:phosphate ABC transporter permease subunit PstC [Hydrogenivirga caldilitoris]RLJ70957.1 phosphate ABC transporter membrane protein 1 (PhoT family) [Hydrogenivirga caldilitoris]